ncbi:HD domain-containing protein [Lachnospira pectinoschiza]|uniref:HD domain-containing protein n=1 Tax=Lachnospira pectinoschiza TaxID=28052 RepID=A0A1G9YA22_9FIRM|nr:HD domain-containing protein [Lachnospira pectinoschiza]SDN05361.1 HD domain-containing protein [Lachnospira pectinoschiza]
MINEELIIEVCKFDQGDPKRIQHFIKVYEYAHLIGLKENLNSESLRILDIAAILHDIGIHPAIEKYGSCNGKLQEKEGPIYAKKLMDKFEEIRQDEKDRVCYLIAHHHTYNNVDGLDLRILLEADFLVNAYEDQLSKKAIKEFRDKVFRTKTGIELINIIYDL